MRILVDIKDPQIKALDDCASRDKKSRSALIRQAIDELLARRKAGEAKDAFGLWGDRTVDGLDYQERVRSEW
jgi:metal-responsive CopG/Arc/MetJ family transcriptional regulator